MLGRRWWSAARRSTTALRGSPLCSRSDISGSRSSRSRRLLADVADSCFSEFRIGPTLDPATSVSAQAGGARTVATDCIWFRSRPEAGVAAAALNDQQKCPGLPIVVAPARADAVVAAAALNDQ